MMDKSVSVLFKHEWIGDSGHGSVPVVIGQSQWPWLNYNTASHLNATAGSALLHAASTSSHLLALVGKAHLHAAAGSAHLHAASTSSHLLALFGKAHLHAAAGSAHLHTTVASARIHAATGSTHLHGAAVIAHLNAAAGIEQPAVQMARIGSISWR
ncbi:hypothetical protein Btru_017892 [Bulinus truncatus]|nr:hypothetical protein Btru_017892 [Bulinus truncatus]